MCEYCDENQYPKKYLIERNTYSSRTDSYIGVGVAINGNILEIEAVGEVGYLSKDTTYVEDNKRIKYCPMCRKEVIKMQIGQYIKLILQKKNMTQQDLVNKLNELHFSAKGGTITKHNISNILNGAVPLHYTMARRIEVALELPKYSLVELVGFPTTEFGKKELEEIGK